MSLESTDSVDAIGIDRETGYIVLTIADAWEWSDITAHLQALQAKLNAYFEFIESGQIWESYPSAKQRQLVIDIVMRFPPPSAANQFLSKATVVAKELNVILRHRYFDGTPEVGGGKGVRNQ